jgi:hypothetical protein
VTKNFQSIKCLQQLAGSLQVHRNMHDCHECSRSEVLFIYKCGQDSSYSHIYTSICRFLQFQQIARFILYSIHSHKVILYLDFSGGPARFLNFNLYKRMKCFSRLPCRLYFSWTWQIKLLVV